MSKKLLIKKSNRPNAGDGLFAKKIFSKGDYVVTYFGLLVPRQIIVNEYNTNKDNYLTKLHPYLREIDNNNQLLGRVDKDVNKCGVMVNDYSKIESKSIEDIKRYVDSSTRNANVYIMDGNKYPIYKALNKIRKEKELYAHYGVSYWLLSMGLTSEEVLEINKNIGGFRKLYNKNYDYYITE